MESEHGSQTFTCVFCFSTDPTKPGDLKESFDIGAFDNKKFVSTDSLSMIDLYSNS